MKGAINTAPTYRAARHFCVLPQPQPNCVCVYETRGMRDSASPDKIQNHKSLRCPDG